MGSSLQAIAAAVPGFVRIGRLRLPVFGIFAAAGLVAALWLSQRTARLADLAAERLWDAGLFAIVAAFVASRVLLVAMDLHAFLQYPLLVLSMPSLTYGGLLLTALLVAFYLRWKRLPWRDVVDGWAPCAALVAAVLSLAHFVEGTEAGMPTRLPWGVVTPGDTVLGRVHPVELYAMVAELVLCAVLLRLLSRRKVAGAIAAAGLMAGGLLSFGLGMLRQPFDTYGNAWLDPAQWVALAGILAGAWLWIVAKPRGLRSFPCGGVLERTNEAAVDAGASRSEPSRCDCETSTEVESSVENSVGNNKELV